MKRSRDEADEAPSKIPTCIRCKAKKIKCDEVLPSCSKCTKAGNACTIYDPVLKREVPRIHSLEMEKKVKELEKRLHVAPEAEAVVSPRDDPIQPKISFSQLMSTAVKVNTKTIPILENPGMGRRDSTTIGDTAAPVIPAILPPKITALQFIHIFFSQANSQSPILHREEFLKKYFVPIYGNIPEDIELSLASNFSNINNAYILSDQVDEEPWFDQYLTKFETIFKMTTVKSDENIRKISNNIRPPKKYHRALYILNMIFAIASSVKHLKYPISISASFRYAAGKFYEKIYQTSDYLETLQGVLLFAVYSTMRPTYPGVWYTLGIALRLCVDLDLHNDSNPYLDPFIIDKRRRLFWCTYSLDRQVCFYLNRPISIHDESINTPFPSILDDAEILPAECSHLAPKLNLPSYKVVTFAILKVRQIQSELQRVLYTNAELPRKYRSLTDWKNQILIRLKDWRESCPTRSEEMNCDFNTLFFDLNYYHALMNIHGLSPKNYTLSIQDFTQVSLASQGLIEIYSKLYKGKTINYTWAAVHNLFLAGSSYLYTIYNCPEVRETNTVIRVKQVTSEVLNILASLVDRCDAAKNCRDVFKNLSIIIIKLKYGETVSIKTDISSDDYNKLDLRANNSMTKLFEVLNHQNELLTTNELNEKIWNDVFPTADQPSPLGWNENGFDESEIDNFFKLLNDNELMEPLGMPTQEGRMSYEAMRKMPNEIIWDQFFSSQI